MNIILASASPRRKELFKLITPEFTVFPADIEERVPDGVSPEEAAVYIAVKKSIAVGKKFPGTMTIGCDTTVLFNNEVLGKPKDNADAERMLRMLSGNRHLVITGCCIYTGSKSISFKEVTEVSFYPLEDGEIREYIETGEPFDKAGAYGIQGRGALLAEKISGDYFNVVGLPVAKLKRKIRELRSMA